MCKANTAPSLNLDNRRAPAVDVQGGKSSFTEIKSSPSTTMDQPHMEPEGHKDWKGKDGEAER